MAFDGAEASNRETAPNPHLTNPPRTEYDARALPPFRGVAQLG